MSAENEKSVSAGVNRDAQREANVTQSSFVKALRFLESETAEHITALFVAIVLIVMSFN